ncbi:hypothetical protein [Photobacterium sp. GB-72]|uniref:hypothetical protein n=1 Tax=Photobacterium sp. GB-72 TaxID=2022105 RepID=UPI000D1529C2|nr:hypothetical protein [Photobacterium sp. GB-72]PSV27633.1 hypothetical protein C9J40_20065 [Photobacterium sp. GB-72]
MNTSDHLYLLDGQVALIAKSMKQHKLNTNDNLDDQCIGWRLSLRKLDREKLVLVWRKVGETSHRRMSYCPAELTDTTSEKMRLELNKKMKMALYIRHQA